jgi:hypothetical protein
MLTDVWAGHIADFQINGPSDDLASSIVDGLSYPDQRLYWSVMGARQENSEFAIYVSSLGVEMDLPPVNLSDAQP